MLKVETHSHTTVSDGFQTPMEIVRIARSRGLDAIAVTDHNTFRGSSLAQRASRIIEGVTVIPGAEIRTTWGDIVVMCTETPSDTFPLNPFELREWALDRGCITIAVHPYHKGFHGIGGKRVYENPHLFDAVEVWNGYSPPPINLPAMLIPSKTGLPPVSGSDAHVPSMVGLTPTLVDSKNSVEDILEAVRRGRVKPTIGLPGARAVIESIAWSLYRVLA